MRRRKSSNTDTVKFVVSIGAIALVAGIGYAAVQRVGNALSDGDIRILVGGCFALAVLLAVGAVFVAWSVSQNRLYRQMLEQDDYDEMRKMAMLLKMSGSRTPNITVRTPEYPQLPEPTAWPYPVQQPGQPAPLDGEYRDAIDLE